MRTDYDDSPSRDDLVRRALSEEFYIGELAAAVAGKFLPPGSSAIHDILGEAVEYRSIELKHIKDLKELCRPELEEDRESEIDLNARDALDFLSNHLNSNEIKISDLKKLEGWSSLPFAIRKVISEGVNANYAAINEDYYDCHTELLFACYNRLDINASSILTKSIESGVNLNLLLKETLSRVGLTSQQIEDIITSDDPLAKLESLEIESKFDDYIEFSTILVAKTGTDHQEVLSITELVQLFLESNSYYLLEDLVAVCIYNSLSDDEKIHLEDHDCLISQIDENSPGKSGFLTILRGQVLIEMIPYISVNMGAVFSYAFDYYAESDYINQMGFEGLIYETYPDLLTIEDKKRLVHEYGAHKPDEYILESFEVLEILATFDSKTAINPDETASIIEAAFEIDLDIREAFATLFKNYFYSEVFNPDQSLKIKRRDPLAIVAHIMDTFTGERFAENIRYGGDFEDKLHKKMSDIFGADYIDLHQIFKKDFD